MRFVAKNSLPLRSTILVAPAVSSPLTATTFEPQHSTSQRPVLWTRPSRYADWGPNIGKVSSSLQIIQSERPLFGTHDPFEPQPRDQLGCVELGGFGRWFRKGCVIAVSSLFRDGGSMTH